MCPWSRSHTTHVARQNYFFDGQELHRDRPDYQLADITDPLIAKYIHNPDNLKDACDPRDGWYKPGTLDLIKAMTRRKFVHIRETGEAAPDAICYHIIEEYNRGTLVFEGGEEAPDGEEGADGSQEGTPAGPSKRKTAGSRRGGKGSKGLVRWAREVDGLDVSEAEPSARQMVEAADAPAEPKKRGRPRKHPVETEPKVPKKRGRPRKVVLEAAPEADEQAGLMGEQPREEGLDDGADAAEPGEGSSGGQDEGDEWGVTPDSPPLRSIQEALAWT